MDSLIQALQEVSQADADFAADTHQATDESGNGRIFNQYVELHDQYVKLRNEQVVKLRKYLQMLDVHECLS
ncbi:hypothetical protein [Streptomyces flaveolus]|uniref:Uncharacterized protein n=1 Tax=Streptomyces flaveolus TaxID=67297 RepID=A0ABV3AKG3_9ACTN